MSHDTGHGHSTENKTIISFKNSFWLVVILVGLFVAALNFINAESGSEEGEGHEKTEMHGAKHEEGHEATHSEATEHHEEAAPHAEEAPAADSAAHH